MRLYRVPYSTNVQRVDIALASQGPRGDGRRSSSGRSVGAPSGSADNRWLPCWSMATTLCWTRRRSFAISRPSSKIPWPALRPRARLRFVSISVPFAEPAQSDDSAEDHDPSAGVKRRAETCRQVRINRADHQHDESSGRPPRRPWPQKQERSSCFPDTDEQVEARAVTERFERWRWLRVRASASAGPTAGSPRTSAGVRVQATTRAAFAATGCHVVGPDAGGGASSEELSGAASRFDECGWGRAACRRWSCRRSR